MRLLNTTTYKLTQFARDVPPYAILSHTWGDEEVTFQDIDLPEGTQKKGYAKILGCCKQARLDSLEWAWVDTCCIDKTSSVELSEAINSMFDWYRNSRVCYVYLEDLPTPKPFLSLQKFRSTRWFTRGWCLQELIAPWNVKFYSGEWSPVGTKQSLCGKIEEITAIPRAVLLGQSNALKECCIAQKLSWASTRETTRIEDEAYCLLGIFGVNMPMLYGEGERAFYRLQEEILRQTEDHSFLLWTEVPDNKLWHMPASQYPIFAPRPACFHRAGPLTSPGRRLGYEALKRSEYSPWTSSLSLPAASPPFPSAPSARSWTWDPSQMTSRGLRVFLPGRVVQETIDTDEAVMAPTEGHRYLMWTGFTFNGCLVCVLLGQDITGPACYVRSGDGIPEVHLLPTETATDFTPENIYLSTSSAAWKRHPRYYPKSTIDPLASPLSAPSEARTLAYQSLWFVQNHATVNISSPKDLKLEIWPLTSGLSFQRLPADLGEDTASGTQVWQAQESWESSLCQGVPLKRITLMVGWTSAETWHFGEVSMYFGGNQVRCGCDISGATKNDLENSRQTKPGVWTYEIGSSTAITARIEVISERRSEKKFKGTIAVVCYRGGRLSEQRGLG